MTQLASLLIKLKPKERIYVESRLAGLTQVASASAAGYAQPRVRGNELEKKEHIQAAIMVAMQETAEEVGFTRREAHDMLMNAYQNAATAAEQIQAVKEMIALHGLAVPKQIEVAVKHSGKVNLERIENDELMKLANMEGLVMDGEFEEVRDDKRLSKL